MHKVFQPVSEAKLIKYSAKNSQVFGIFSKITMDGWTPVNIEFIRF